MVISKLATSKPEILDVCIGMQTLGNPDPLIACGYWHNNKCIGGVYLDKNFPYYLVMEFKKPKSVSILKAIRDSFVCLLAVKPKLLAKIHLTNRPSLKIAKQLGFYILYIEGDHALVELSPETWRYQKRYPITKEAL